MDWLDVGAPNELPTQGLSIPFKLTNPATGITTLIGAPAQSKYDTEQGVSSLQIIVYTLQLIYIKYF
jgi:hypothetical protein